MVSWEQVVMESLFGEEEVRQGAVMGEDWVERGVRQEAVMRENWVERVVGLMAS